jgi:hypothetical protein
MRLARLALKADSFTYELQNSGWSSTRTTMRTLTLHLHVYTHHTTLQAEPLRSFDEICTVRVFRQGFTLEDAIGSHAFALLEVLSCV